MHSQKKEELLVQLDNALKRKVEQKYKKNLKTQELVSPQSSKLIEQEKIKVNTRYEQLPSTRPIHTSRSPLVYNAKEIEAVPSKPFDKHDHKNKLGLSSNQISKLNTDREFSYAPNVEEAKDNQLKEQMKKLKGRNIMLQRELRQLKETIEQLQNESKTLKRQQSEFSILKNQNNSLIKEIEYLRARPAARQSLKITQMQFLEQQLKKLLISLNCSLILKEVKSQNFITEAFRSISIQINKLIDEKSKISHKLNIFDIQTLMAKQNSSMLKKQVDILREQNEQLQDLIQDNCLRVEQLEQQLQSYEQQKRNLQAKYKQVIKQLEGIKKEFKYTIQASRSSRPKREKPCFMNKEGLTDSTVVRFTVEANSQTDETVVETCSFQQIVKPNNYQQPINRGVEQENRLNITYIAQLQSSNLQNDILRSQLQHQIIKMEQQIEQLNKRCDRYRKEAVQLSNQLKEYSQASEQLISQNAKKDEEIIKRIKSINQLRGELDQQTQKLQEVSNNLKTEQLEKDMILEQKNIAIYQVQRLKSTIRQNEDKNNALQQQIIYKKQQFERQLFIQSKKMQELWNKQHSQLVSQINNKQNKFCEIQKQFTVKNAELAIKVKQLESEWRNSTQSLQRLKARELQFEQLRITLTQKLNQIYSYQKERDQLIYDYEMAIKAFEEKVKDFELETYKINECIKYLQKSNKQLLEQTKHYQQAQNSLLQKIDGMSRQIFTYKCDVQRLSFDSKNNAQLKEYFQQVSNQLKSKLQQLLQQITKTQTEKSQIIAKKLEIENQNQQISLKQNKIKFALEQKTRENDSLKKELEHRFTSYSQLENQFLIKQQQMRQLDRAKTEQIALQTYDIERLMKQIKDLKAKLDQLNSLKESKNYQSNESQQTIMLLTQQNRSLARQHQMLLQQIRMKQANKQEDLYLNQLKSKQYCMLIKKILIINEDNVDLINCDNFEELLQIGAQRTLAKKKHQRDEESISRKTRVNDHQFEINIPTKRYYIGTQISSSEEMFEPKTFGIGDQLLKTESKLSKTQRDLESPRSFKFSLSPFQEKQKQKRTQRLISYFDPNQSNQYKTKSKIQQEKGSQF